MNDISTVATSLVKHVSLCCQFTLPRIKGEYHHSVSIFLNSYHKFVYIWIARFWLENGEANFCYADLWLIFWPENFKDLLWIWCESWIYSEVPFSSLWVLRLHDDNLQVIKVIFNYLKIFRAKNILIFVNILKVRELPVVTAYLIIVLLNCFDIYVGEHKRIRRIL